jgi:DNA-binding CsgD family transcriptional regulator
VPATDALKDMQENIILTTLGQRQKDCAAYLNGTVSMVKHLKVNNHF